MRKVRLYGEAGGFLEEDGLLLDDVSHLRLLLVRRVRLHRLRLHATLKNWYFLTGDKSDVYSFSNDGFRLYAGENKDVEGGFEHSGLFALIDKEGYIRSRTVVNGEMENPIKFYNGLDEKEIQWLKEDINILLKE